MKNVTTKPEIHALTLAIRLQGTETHCSLLVGDFYAMTKYLVRLSP
jgi:hypothetical protein